MTVADVCASSGKVPKSIGKQRIDNAKTMSQRSEMRKFWSENYKSAQSKYTDDEVDAIRWWTAEDSAVDTNKILRQGGELASDQVQNVAKLDSIIARSNIGSDDLKVFRGFGRNPPFEFKKGMVFADEGYAATTASRSTAMRHQFLGPPTGGDELPTIARIVVPKGTPAGYFGYMNKSHGLEFYEDEILFGRGTRFRVLSVKKEYNKIGKFWSQQVELELIP